MTDQPRARFLRAHSIHLAAAALLGLAIGCARQQAVESIPEQPAVVLAPPLTAGADEPKAQPAVAGEPEPPPKPPAEAFAFPPDLTGKALARVVAPDVSRPLVSDRPRPGPKPRTVPSKVLEPDVIARASYALPPLASPKLAAARPVNPAEKVPVGFGAGAEGGPARPVLPVAPVATARARDVNVPPPAPTLGRRASDRASLDDPTSELGNAEVVAGVVKTPLAPSPFLKVTVPDPFELADQVKPKLPPSAEPSAAPVPVNPQRVK